MSHTPTDAVCAHVRDNNGVLAGIERRALIRLAHRIPRRINSDHLSALGLSAMAVTGLSFAAFVLTPWAAWGVVLSLAFNWLGDSLDGTLARVRGHQRPRYGYYVDHAIDLAGATLLMTGLAFSGLMSPLIAAAVLAAYLLVSAETYLATHSRGVFRMAVFGFGPTELRILLSIGTLQLLRSPYVSIAGHRWLLFDVGGAIAITALLVTFIVAAVATGRLLYRQEPLPARQRPPLRFEELQSEA